MLDKKQRYLQIALNSSPDEARNIISQIPLDRRIIIEVGTPLIEEYGVRGIREIRNFWEQRIFGTSVSNIELNNTPWWLNLLTPVGRKFPARRNEVLKKDPSMKNKEAFTPYIIADLKCMDRGIREVEIAQKGGANAATALGSAPIETLDSFIEKCEEYGIDSMIDMMNVDFPLNVLRKLKNIPQVVILHRGVDEEHFNSEKEIPFYEIQRIKSNYDILIAIAGGDTFQEVQRALFNDADIVVVWKSFYSSTEDTAKLAEEFLREIR